MTQHLRSGDFTLCKAALLAGLIVIGQLAVSLRDSEVDGDETYETATLYVPVQQTVTR